MRLWIIAYDIADDKRRRHLAACLGKHMQRVQESIFEGWFDALQIKAIVEELRPLIDDTEDKLRAYPLAVRTAKRHATYGQQHPTPKRQDYWIIG